MRVASSKLQSPNRLVAVLCVLAAACLCLGAEPLAAGGEPPAKTIEADAAAKPSTVFNPQLAARYSLLTSDEDDLSKRLIRQATGGDDGGIMGRILRLMDQAGRSLGRDFDPTESTQTVQRQIVEKLDEAIAAAQRRRSKGTTQHRPSSDKRQAPPQPDPKQQADRSGEGQAAADAAAKTSPSGGADGQSAATGRFREFRRSWGHLPARDRDEVLQGIDEDVLEKYRRLIERYFRTLAEENEEE